MIAALPTAFSSERTVLRDQLERLCRNRSTLAPQPSGFPELDAQLPGGGWPVGALTECLIDAQGIGELSLWLPALRTLACAHRYIAFINPPFVLYAPALVQHGVPLQQIRLVSSASAEDSLWATEQTLRCAAFGAVLAWPSNINDRQLRRLQLAAEEGRNIGILYRSMAAARDSSPAALRIKLHTSIAAPQDIAIPKDIEIAIHKCRGAHGNATLRCTLNRFAPPQTAQAV